MKKLKAILTCIKIPTYEDGTPLDLDYKIGQSYDGTFSTLNGLAYPIEITNGRTNKHSMSVEFASEHFTINISLFSGN